MMPNTSLASPAAEIRRLRAENDQLRRLIVAADPTTTPEYWRSLYADAHRLDLEYRWRAGWEAAERHMAASWAAVTEPVVHPERGAERRLRSAEAGCRRDAAEHERAFVARAYNTADRDRTDVQRATVRLFPPKVSAT